MPGKPIDVWNLDTFDRQLRSILENHADLIRSYNIKEQEIFLEHDLGRGKKKRFTVGATYQHRYRLIQRWFIAHSNVKICTNLSGLSR